MLKINGYETNYNQLLIYNEKGEILFKTERPYDLNIQIQANVRNARKLNFAKGDCFEISTTASNTYLWRNGKDIYIPTSMIDVIKIEEKKAFEAHGETNYKMEYTFKLNNGDVKTVEGDFYVRSEKTAERLLREKIAKIMSECAYTNTTISHYEVEIMLKKLDIKIKEN